MIVGGEHKKVIFSKNKTLILNFIKNRSKIIYVQCTNELSPSGKALDSDSSTS